MDSAIPKLIQKHPQWADALQTLHQLTTQCGLEETVKWGMPVYTYAEKNIVGIAAFSAYAGIWFFQGALLKDPGKVLINAQKEKTKAMRQWRFTEQDAIPKKQVMTYLQEAKELAKSGKELKPDRNKPINIPIDLADAFQKNAQAKKLFDEMSMSCRREYCDYIQEAKRPETKIKRVEKSMRLIMEKRGLNEQYR
jgi:uncharacterized protein YdeI (YjbR/CyaY-like superfamily)